MYHYGSCHSFFEHLKPQLVTGWLVVSNPQVRWNMAMHIHFYYAKERHVALVEHNYYTNNNNNNNIHKVMETVIMGSSEILGNSYLVI